ncbi:hypothetical protein KAW11_03360 [Candidatus Bathyarchaeota archaeon]|nr:hypothetical protein [Candidatus Bathyarchaeota archaeon]
MKPTTVIALFSIFAGILILIHHLVTMGRIFDVNDVLHHEFFAGITIAFGLGILTFRMKGSR